jgi:hypothetical protein
MNNDSLIALRRIIEAANQVIDNAESLQDSIPHCAVGVQEPELTGADHGRMAEGGSSEICDAEMLLSLMKAGYQKHMQNWDTCRDDSLKESLEAIRPYLATREPVSGERGAENRTVAQESGASRTSRNGESIAYEESDRTAARPGQPVESPYKTVSGKPSYIRLTDDLDHAYSQWFNSHGTARHKLVEGEFLFWCSANLHHYRNLKLPMRESVADGWQPMKTAPHNGTRVLLLNEPNEVKHLPKLAKIGFYQPIDGGFMEPGYWRFEGAEGPSYSPVGWMPLPNTQIGGGDQ